MSKLFTINLADLAKGAIVAALATVLCMVSTILNAGHFPNGEDWKSIGMAALTALGAYIAKNLFTNGNGEFLASEKKPLND
jgi:hypothetical protein